MQHTDWDNYVDMIKTYALEVWLDEKIDIYSQTKIAK